MTRSIDEGAPRGAFFVLCLRLLAVGLLLTGPTGARAVDCLADRIDESVRVAHVYDGDTIRLTDGRKVRLIGINTPELAHEDGPRHDEPYAREARRAVRDLLDGNGRLGLRLGHERRDRYRRLLAHAYLADGRSLEGILLSRGLAIRIAIPPNTHAQDCYARAEREARQRKRGLWSAPYFQPLPSDRLPAGIEGFRLVEGRVLRVGRSRRSVWLDMPGRFAVRIPKRSLEHFASTPPEDWQGETVVVRGWIHTYRGRPIMTVRHPSSIEVTTDGT